MKKFKETLVKEVEIDELDLDFPFYNAGSDDSNEVDLPDNIWAEVPSMDIDQAIKSLTELKEMGANRIYFYAHTDHHGYIFTGVKLEEK